MASATIHEKLGSGPGNGGARLIVGVILGFGITLFLFWLMQYMIETADRSLDEGSRGSLVDFVRVQRDETIQRRQVKPKKPPPPENAPPQPPTPQMDNLDPTAEKIAISDVPVETEIEMSGGFSLGVGEGDYLPIAELVRTLEPPLANPARRALVKAGFGDLVAQSAHAPRFDLRTKESDIQSEGYGEGVEPMFGQA